MKKIIITTLLSGFLNFLFSCKQEPITKRNLIGIWHGEKHNGTLIKDKGFNSIQLTFTEDSVEVIVDMKAFGGQVTTKSSGSWELNKNIIKTRFADQAHECIITLNNKNMTLTFKPDLFFKSESVMTSEYKKDN